MVLKFCGKIEVEKKMGEEINNVNLWVKFFNDDKS